MYVFYFYWGKNEDGKSVEIPLGTDIDVAKIEWAKLEQKTVPRIVKTLGQISDCSGQLIPDTTLSLFSD